MINHDPVSKATLIGGRNKQQDSLFDFTMPRTDKAEDVLTTAFRMIDDIIGQPYGGSTATVAIADHKTMTLAIIGDSPAFFAIIDRDGQAVNIVDLLKRADFDHKPANPKECERIIREGGEIEEGRLGGILAMTRAFGNKAIKGVSAEPDSMICKLPTLAEGETGLLIIATDGLTSNLSPSDILDIIEQAIPMGRDPADSLARVANMENGEEGDNVSVVVLKFPNQLDDAKCHVIGVCDGHGPSGGEISRHATEMFRQLIPQIAASPQFGLTQLSRVGPFEEDTHTLT